MGVHWSASKQGGVADSTPMAELDSMHSALKNDGLPIADLLEFLLGRPVHIEVMEDNTTAISTAKAGYSPKMRYLHRSRRIDLEWLGDVFQDERNKLVHAPSETQKGDLLTKEFDKSKFDQCKKLVGLSAAVLRESVGTEYVYHNGKLRKLPTCADQPMNTSLRASAGNTESTNNLHNASLRSSTPQLATPAKVLIPGVNSWVIDTGSGHHLVSQEALCEHEAQSLHEGEELKLATANGIIKDRRIAQSIVPELDDLAVDVRVLKQTPRVLSVQKLVEDGASFVWDEHGARLLHNGKLHNLIVTQGVPLLSLPCVGSMRPYASPPK